jgi:hypothetical protein
VISLRACLRSGQSLRAAGGGQGSRASAIPQGREAAQIAVTMEIYAQASSKTTHTALKRLGESLHR